MISSATFINTTLSFAGDVTISGDTVAQNSYIALALYSRYLMSFFQGQMNIMKTLFDVCNNFETSNLILDQSSMNILAPNIDITISPLSNPFDGGASLKAGLLLMCSNVKGLSDTSLIFETNNGFTFNKCIVADDASLISLQGNIKSNGIVNESIVLTEQSSKALLGYIGVSAIPSTILRSTTGAEIEHFRGTITVDTNGSSAAMDAMTGGKNYLASGTSFPGSDINNTSASPSSARISETAAGEAIYYDSNKKLYLSVQ